MIAQYDGADQQTESAQVSLMDAEQSEAAKLTVGLKRFLDLVRTEFELIEGTNLQHRIQFVIERYDSDSTARILWILIALMLTSGSIFVLSIAFGLLVRPRRSATLRRRRRSRSSAKKTKSTRPAPHSGRSMVGMLKEGRLKDVEKLLLAQHRRQPVDSTAVMYLLACRATADSAAYDDLISELFSKGLDRSIQICLHAAEIGRLIKPDSYPLKQYPEPESAFVVDNTVSGNTLGPISEFGDVQTLLDLVRVYVDMEDEAEVKHLTVEILVRGNCEQRRQALEFHSKLVRKKSAS